MKISVFTSNQARHLALVEALAKIADEIWAVLEVRTLFPGEVEDSFPATPVMRAYFARVSRAQARVFGGPRFLPDGVCVLPMRMGDLSRLDLDALRPALKADVLVVFGASWIRPPLIDLLIERRTFNIHIGTSPYYRGSSCNFWAMYDGRPDYVGATIHLLSRGLDAGPILFHAFPPTVSADPFDLGMLAVRAAHHGLLRRLVEGTLGELEPVPQDRGLEIRYTRGADFGDPVAAEYLGRLPTAEACREALIRRDLGRFVRPFVDAS